MSKLYIEICNIVGRFSNYIAEHKFIFCSLLVAFLACSFQFWIAYPGWINWDTIALTIIKDTNLEPVSITYVFLGLFKLFGRHVWLILLVSVIPFYLGLFVLSLAFYRRYNSFWALLLFFPMFIQNIFVSNFILLSTSMLANFSFLLFAIILYYVLNPSKHKNILLFSLAVIMYILSLFVRHNGIIQVCFAPLIIIYLYLKNLNLTKKQFLLRYLFLILCSAIISVCIVVVPSKILPIREEMSPSFHILANELAAMCVPADDSACFEEKWYVKGKNWQDLKFIFNSNPTNANILAFHRGRSQVINSDIIEPNEMKEKFLYAVKKYPLNLVQHEVRLLSTICTEPMYYFAERAPYWDGKSPFYITFNFYTKFDISSLKIFPADELYLHETPLKLKLLHVWDDYMPKTPTMFWVILLTIYSIFSFLLFKKMQKENIFVYNFLLSLGGIFAVIIYGGFYPEPVYRYMHPIWVYGVLVTIAYVAILIDRVKK